MNGIAAFHHLGVACRSLQPQAAVYGSLGYVTEGREFDDAAHGIRGVFLTGPGPRIELVVNRPGSSVLEPWLRRGGGVYHFAFEVDDIDRAIDERISMNAKLLVAPTSAVAFNGRSVAFLMLRNRLMIELIATS